jgi:hypothetical protein
VSVYASILLEMGHSPTEDELEAGMTAMLSELNRQGAEGVAATAVVQSRERSGHKEPLRIVYAPNGASRP